MIHTILHSLLEYTNEFLSKHEPLTPRADLATSFIADIGKLANRHIYFRSLAKILTLLIERCAVKRINEATKIWGPNLLMEAKRVLPLFAKIGLCSFEVQGDDIKLECSQRSIVKRAAAWIQTEPTRNETASFLLGYVLLYALDETIEILDSQKKLGFSQGVACLYPVEYDKNGNLTGLRMPKGITAVLSFILGSWARGWNEFDELTLHNFLDKRGVTGKEYNEAAGLLSQTVPGVDHSILEFETYSHGGVPIKRFRYSEAVRNLRELLRNRVRERVERT
jgi:hypothetical protein